MKFIGLSEDLKLFQGGVIQSYTAFERRFLIVMEGS